MQFSLRRVIDIIHGLIHRIGIGIAIPSKKINESEWESELKI